MSGEPICCDCGDQVKTGVCNGGKNQGKTYMTCPNRYKNQQTGDYEGGCGFFKFADVPRGRPQAKPYSKPAPVAPQSRPPAKRPQQQQSQYYPDMLSDIEPQSESEQMAEPPRKVKPPSTYDSFCDTVANSARVTAKSTEAMVALCTKLVTLQEQLASAMGLGSTPPPPPPPPPAPAQAH